MLNKLYSSVNKLHDEMNDKNKYLNYATEILIDKYPAIAEVRFDAKRLMDNKSAVLGMSAAFAYNIKQVSTDLRNLISSITKINSDLDKLPSVANASINAKSNSELNSKIDVIKNDDYNLLKSYTLSKQIEEELKLLNSEFDDNLKAMYALINEIEFQLRSLCVHNMRVNELEYDEFRKKIIFCYVNVNSIKKCYDKIKPLSEKMRYDILRIMTLLKQINVADKQLKLAVESMLNVLRKGHTSN